MINSLADKGWFLLYPANWSPFDSINHFSQRSSFSGWGKKKRQHQEGSSCLSLVSHPRLLCESGTTGKRERGMRSELVSVGEGRKRQGRGRLEQKNHCVPVWVMPVKKTSWRSSQAERRRASIRPAPSRHFYFSLPVFSSSSSSWSISHFLPLSPPPLYLPRLPSRRPAPLHQPPQDFMILLNDRWDALDSAYSPLGSPVRVPSVVCGAATRRRPGRSSSSGSLSWNVCVAKTDETWLNDEQSALWMGGVSCSEIHLFAQRRVLNKCLAVRTVWIRSILVSLFIVVLVR